MSSKWFAVLLAFNLFSCGKGFINPSLPVINNPSPVYYFPVTLTVDQEHPGYKIPSTFEGLSYETGLLAESPEFLNENNTVLIQLIKNLGDGILRIGGNTSDEIRWTGNTRDANTPLNRLTPTDIDRLSAFSRAIGWRVIFGLNLACNNATEASSEARYVHNSLRYNLYAFQSGNEPDVFKFGPRNSKYKYHDYQSEWDTYLSAVKKAVPQSIFAGPDITPFNSYWIIHFAANEKKNIKLLDGHYYATGPAADPSINYQNILTPNPKLADYLASLNDESSKNQLPFRISECNSVFGGGKSGVSDIFASSLWALDFMWAVAENKGQGINFHGGGRFFVYTPIADENGVFTARPEYYAMLAFKYGGTGKTIIPIASNEPGYNLSVHACVNTDNSYSITLINKDEFKNFSFNIQLSKTASTVKIDRLTAPAIDSKTGITFAGSTVNSDGTFVPASTEQYTVNQKNFVVKVCAGSAAVITIK
ncbi:MAG: hypothetical protein JWQ63_538 [Mucilaginibacter sp.]|jgi:hypothetical protein|nr:hypothetical protein [Mucilaginibacter sp.]